jgi:hypothetical protein
MNTCRRKLIIVLPLACAGVIALFVWKSVPPPEPVYRGKPLRVWLDEWRANEFPTTNWATRSDKAKQEAADAVRAIGPDAIPFLLKSLRFKHPSIKSRLREIIPARWHSALHLNYGPYDSQIPGMDGFAILGPLGAPALPQLIKLGQDGEANHSRWAVGALGSLRSAGDPAIPFLIQSLTNADWQTRQMAAWSLCTINKQPDIVIPALIEYLKFLKTLSLTAEDIYCIDYLTFWGTNAKPAVPVILEFLESPDVRKREAVTNCLPRIDPEAAKCAHVWP